LNKTTKGKKFKKIFKRSLLTLFIAVAALAAILLFPQLLFANKMRYKNFRVCSNNKISNDIKIVLDNAISLVERSELYDSNYHYNIILCHNTFYNRIDNLLGIGPAVRSRLHNVIVKVRIDSKNNLAFATFPKECELDLTYILAHEMIHCQQANRYGIKKFNPFTHPEFWKLEGYPEYISRKPQLSSINYSLVMEIQRYIDLKKQATNIWAKPGEGGCEFPDYYFKGRLMMEYLIDIKHFTYDRILRDSVSENTIFNEMIKWKDSTKVTDQND